MLKDEALAALPICLMAYQSVVAYDEAMPSETGSASRVLEARSLFQVEAVR